MCSSDLSVKVWVSPSLVQFPLRQHLCSLNAKKPLDKVRMACSTQLKMCIRDRVNAGNIQNSGIEIALNTTPIKTKDWQLDLDFTYTRNRSKIVSLHPNVANYIELSGYCLLYTSRCV